MEEPEALEEVQVEVKVVEADVNDFAKVIQEKFEEARDRGQVRQSENLEDVIAPELSTSTERLDGVVTLDFADEKTGDFYDKRVGDLREVEIDSGQK